jgi:hypothetical protein
MLSLFRTSILSVTLRRRLAAAYSDDDSGSIPASARQLLQQQVHPREHKQGEQSFLCISPFTCGVNHHSHCSQKGTIGLRKGLGDEKAGCVAGSLRHQRCDVDAGWSAPDDRDTEWRVHSVERAVLQL